MIDTKNQETPGDWSEAEEYKHVMSLLFRKDGKCTCWMLYHFINSSSPESAFLQELEYARDELEKFKQQKERDATLAIKQSEANNRCERKEFGRCHTVSWGVRENAHYLPLYIIVIYYTYILFIYIISLWYVIVCLLIVLWLLLKERLKVTILRRCSSLAWGASAMPAWIGEVAARSPGTKGRPCKASRGSVESKQIMYKSGAL